MPAPVAASASVAQDHTNPTNISLASNKPTGLAVGDVIGAFFWSHHSTTISADTPPASWTTAITRSEIPTGAEELRNAFYWKVADAADVAASTFTFARTGGICYGATLSLVRITGAAAASITDQSNYTSNADGLTTISFPSITTTVNNDLILLGLGGYGATGAPNGSSWPNAAPSGHTIVTGSTYLSGDLGGYSLNAGIASKTMATAGATGSATVPFSQTVDGFAIAITVAIKPTVAIAYPTTPPFIANLLR